MISMIICSRISRNPDSNLQGFLQSIVDNSTEEEMEQLEVLIKFDNDDYASYSPEHNAALRDWPFKVKTITFGRGEGREGLATADNILIQHRDERSRFIHIGADDFLFSRPFISEILAINDPYFVTCSVGSTARMKGVAEANRSRPFGPDGHYHLGTSAWSPVPGGPEGGWGWLPCISVPLIQILHGLGQDSNVDSFIQETQEHLWRDHKINLIKEVEYYYTRHGTHSAGHIGPDQESHNPNSFWRICRVGQLRAIEEAANSIATVIKGCPELQPDTQKEAYFLRPEFSAPKRGINTIQITKYEGK